MSRCTALFVLFVLSQSLAAETLRVLFDGRHGQTAGSADWIVDADASDQYWDTFRCEQGGNHHSAQRFPTPPQEDVRLDTPETFWSGGISAWALALAKDSLRPERGRSWRIEQYPWDAPGFSFGDPTNPQDLSGYDVLMLVEPNVLFTDDEQDAIRQFVWNGGGLFMVADHETSDRNCSGGAGELHDSPLIFNRLMQTDVETSRTSPYFDPSDPDNDYGIFGIWFYENGNDDQADRENRAFDWFTEPTNDNVSTDLSDPIIRGPFGDGSAGLGLFGSTQMAVSTSTAKGNATARAHLWRNGQSRDQNAVDVWERVTLASAHYGGGRVVAVGDSSPADDGTGEGQLHDGWDKAQGVANDILLLNATEWLASPEPDLTPPIIVSGPAAGVGDCSAIVSWETDEPATSRVRWGPVAPFANQSTELGYHSRHAVKLEGLIPGIRYSYRVSSVDASRNGPTGSAIAEFTTREPDSLEWVEQPTNLEVGVVSATLQWATSKPSTARIEYGADNESPKSLLALREAVSHRLSLSGLEPDTTYLYRIEARDACGSLVFSDRQIFTTSARPPGYDISGWSVINAHTDIVYTIPQGTTIPENGFVVIGRDSDREAFESEWGPLAPRIVYLNSQNGILINSTPRAYRLFDSRGELIDGPSVDVRSGQSHARKDGCASSSDPNAWERRPDTRGDPGRGAPLPCGAGVVISEMADGTDFRNEFVEIYYDP